jgi:tetratricopeptide (TPR) repeat protein
VEAREAGRLDDAAAAYRRAVHLRPAWDEGWWYLATVLYEQQQDAAARDAFTRFLALKPDAGRAFALRGLCEFRLRQYDRALTDLRKAQALGLAGSLELTRSVWYHATGSSSSRSSR